MVEMSENSKEIHSVSWAEKIREKKFLHQNDNKKVLVIEDDACMRMLMQRKLERHGFQAKTLESEVWILERNH